MDDKKEPTEPVPNAIDEVLDPNKVDPEFLYWIPIDVNMYEHRKTRRLAQALAIPRPYAIGLVVTFLCKVFKFATSGDITGNRTEEIVHWAEYPGEKDFIKAMVDAGFLDTIENGYRVHKWQTRMDSFLRKLSRTQRNRERNTKAQQKRRKGLAFERARKQNQYAAGDPTYLRRRPQKDTEIQPGIGTASSVSSDVNPTREKEGMSLSATNIAQNTSLESAKQAQNGHKQLTDTHIPVSRDLAPTRYDKKLHDLHDFQGGQKGGVNASDESRISMTDTDIPMSPTCRACSVHRREEKRREDIKTKAGTKNWSADDADPAFFSFSPQKKWAAKDNPYTHEKTVDLWFVLFKAHLAEASSADRGFVGSVMGRLTKAGSHYSEIQKRMEFWFHSNIPWVKRMHYRLDKFEKKFSELAAGPLVQHGDTPTERRPDGGYDKPKGDERTIDDFD